MYVQHPTSKIWHKVHPLDLQRSVCSTSRGLTINAVCEELPANAVYCLTCEKREHFVAAVSGS